MSIATTAFTLANLTTPADLAAFWQANRDRLNDPVWLAAAIHPQCRFKHSKGGILEAQQNPQELAQWLVLAASVQPTSYMEIGVYKCGTFILTDSYLRVACPAYQFGMALDKRSMPEPLLLYACEPRLNQNDQALYKKAKHFTADQRICYYRSFSRRAFRGDTITHFDVVMVDACHGALSTFRDFAIAKSRNPRLIAVHDIEFCKGRTGLAWETIKKEHSACRTWEFVSASKKRGVCFGIGVVQLR